MIIRVTMWYLEQEWSLGLEIYPPKYILYASNCLYYITELFFFYWLFAFSRASPMAYGDSHDRGLIRAVATGLRQSYNNTGSELHLQPRPQLMAKQDP